MTHLHVKSCYSFLEGAGTPEELVRAAAERGIRNLALTDRAGVYGAVDFVRRATEAGIHPIVGAEIPQPEGDRVVVLCRDADGYAALCRFLTWYHLQGPGSAGRPVWEGDSPSRGGATPEEGWSCLDQAWLSPVIPVSSDQAKADRNGAESPGVIPPERWADLAGHCRVLAATPLRLAELRPVLELSLIHI